MLDQPVKEVMASAPDHRKHRSRWRIILPALPAFYGIFPGTFLLTAWFSRMLGILLIDWSTQEVVAWPIIPCYRLFRKAPPWVLWNVLPFSIQLMELHFEIYPDTLAFLEWCFELEDWLLWKYHNRIIPWCQLNAQFGSCTFLYTPFGVPFYELCPYDSICRFEDKYLGECILEPTQCYSIGSFPFAQRQCFNATPTDCHLELARKQAKTTLVNSGLERDTCSLTFDTGASQCLTGVKSDFIELFPEGAKHSVIKGIAQGLDIEGEGLVEEYTLSCDDGSTVTIRAKAYFVPDLGS